MRHLKISDSFRNTGMIEPESRELKVSIDKAREWYIKGGELRDLALSIFTETELQVNEFQELTDFDKVLQYLQERGVIEDTKKTGMHLESLERVSTSLVACTKLELIRRALNLNTESRLWMYLPKVYVVKELPENYKEEAEVVGKYVFGGEHLPVLNFHVPFCHINPYVDGGKIESYCPVIRLDSILRCGSKEIAVHFGKYFWKEIIESTKQ